MTVRFGEKGNTVDEQLQPGARKLMLVNALRSIGQGMMVVDLTLYLDLLGWRTAAIGSVLAAGGILGIGLAPFIGIYSDRVGRKRLILFYELLTAGCALIGVLSTNPVLLFIAITLTGFGKADAGSPSPAAPAEQAWLAAFITKANRGKVYSLNNALSFFGMAAGAMLAGLTNLWADYLPVVSSYQAIFIFIFVLTLVTTGIIFTIQGGEPKKLQGNLKMESVKQEKKTLHKENTAVLKLAAINILNGIAIGLTGPMMAYWLSAKFGASNTQIGSTLAVTFFATGVTSILQAKLSSKHGTIQSVVMVRFFTSLLLVLMPLLTSYALVSIVYIVRTALNRGTQGAQQALSVSLTRDTRRGFASSIHIFSMRLPISIGPYFAGYLFGLGSLSLPFYIASGLQFSFAYLYGKLFRAHDINIKPHASSVD